MKINKNKTIILVLLIILFIILGLITYYFLILSDVVVKQEEDISLIKNYITEESDVFESDELDVDYSLLTIEEKKDLIAEQEKVNPNIRASLVYDNLGYQVYAFNNSIQGLDLNFDEANDVIIKSRIYGADYYDSLENEERVVYSFYIDRWEIGRAHV